MVVLKGRPEKYLLLIDFPVPNKTNLDQDKHYIEIILAVSNRISSPSLFLNYVCYRSLSHRKNQSFLFAVFMFFLQVCSPSFSLCRDTSNKFVLLITGSHKAAIDEKTE